MKNKLFALAIGALLGLATWTATTTTGSTAAAKGHQLDSRYQVRAGEILDAYHAPDFTGYMILSDDRGHIYRADIDPEDLFPGYPVFFVLYDGDEVVRVHADNRGCE